jgi:hypothetical protein
MDSSTSHFLKAAVAAFPPANQALAVGAASTLLPFVDNNYRLRSVPVTVLGTELQVPRRIHFLGLVEENLKAHSTSWPATQCLCTRSTDGYRRQAALRCILSINEPWSIPFVVLLAGEYVVEIVDDMVAALWVLDREIYINFVRENRDLMRLLRSRATSYWDCYYRPSYPNRRSYPGLAFLHQLELWAS